MPYLSAMSGPMTYMLMTVNKVEKLPSPRVIRPHLPFYLLPPELLDTAKVLRNLSQTCRVHMSLIIYWLQVVYVARNPKDVIVSYYFHHKLIKVHGYTGTLDEFAEFFMNDERKSNNIRPSTFRITDETFWKFEQQLCTLLFSHTFWMPGLNVTIRTCILCSTRT